MDGERTPAAIWRILGPKPSMPVALVGLSSWINSTTCWVVIYGTVKWICDETLRLT